VARTDRQRSTLGNELSAFEQLALFSLDEFAAILTYMEFEAFYKTEMPKVILHLMRLGASLDEAADGAQSAFVAMWPQWELVESPKAYVRVSAHRAYMRIKFGEYSSHHTTPLPETFDRATPLPQLCVAELSEQESTIVEILSALPPMQQLVMAWTFDGFTPAEIAQQLGQDPTTVRQSLFKARKKLKQNLSQNGRTS
jgi:RNA polymerase sigma factor (sigma-70 family)